MTELHLRRMAIFVDEPDPGLYHWVLIESRHDATVWAEVNSSEQSFNTWNKAYRSGLAELMLFVPDLDKGPLAYGEDENASHVG